MSRAYWKVTSLDKKYLCHVPETKRHLGRREIRRQLYDTRWIFHSGEDRWIEIVNDYYIDSEWRLYHIPRELEDKYFDSSYVNEYI